VALTVAGLRSGGDAFMEDVSREEYRALAGLQRDADLQAAYARHARVLGREALELTLQLYQESAEGGEERRATRMLLEWQTESQSGRVVAREEEREIAWEASAMVHVGDGRAVPYAGVSIQIANATDRRERQSLDDARAALVERELVPIRRDRLERERGFVESLDVAPSYNATFEATSGVSLGGLADECRALLERTAPLWDDVLPRELRKRLGVKVGEATRADALALFRAREFDDAFPGGALESSIRRQTSEMGLDVTASGRIVLDTGDREGKRARAFCAPVRVPDEVYLVLRPHGGQQDYTTFLHELGHALHFAHMRPELPFEARWVGDNSVTEGYAMLFDHLTGKRDWLLRYTGLSRERVGAYLRGGAFEELHMLRRYASKLLYEIELYGGGVPWESMPDLYVETLRAGTRFQYQRADAFVDVDPRFYSTRYLRAWQLQGVLDDALVERFDADWYRNPNAGPWMIGELFGEGQRELAPELAQRVAGRGLSFEPLARGLERAFGG
jgi:hypothetical protein